MQQLGIVPTLSLSIKLFFSSIVTLHFGSYADESMGYVEFFSTGEK